MAFLSEQNPERRFPDFLLQSQTKDLASLIAYYVVLLDSIQMMS